MGRFSMFSDIVYLNGKRSGRDTRQCPPEFTGCSLDICDLRIRGVYLSLLLPVGDEVDECMYSSIQSISEGEW